jgi:hypothetical protein
MTGEPLGTGSQSNIIDSILLKPPPGYVFLVMASQDSHYDLFMLSNTTCFGTQIEDIGSRNRGPESEING